MRIRKKNRLSHNAYFQLRILHHYLHTTDMASICEVWHKIAQMPGTPAADEQMFVERFIEGIDDLSAFISQAYRGGQLVLIDDIGEGFVKAADAKATLGIPANLIDDALEQGFKKLEATLDPADPQKCHIAAGAYTLGRGIALSKSLDPSPDPHL